MAVFFENGNKITVCFRIDDRVWSCIICGPDGKIIASGIGLTKQDAIRFAESKINNRQG